MASEVLKQGIMTKSLGQRSLTSILGKSFWAAYLLTGNAASAEEVVRQAIDLWDCDEKNSEQLLYASVRIAAKEAMNCEYELHKLLPEGLCRVAGLPPALRSCFVLRMLLGLPSSICAQILGMPASHVNQQSRDAVTSLGAP